MNEQNPTLYPLTAAQKLHFYSLKYCPYKQLLNIGTSLTILEDVDFSILKESIYEAYARSEAMRIRFRYGEDGELYQYVAEKETRDIEFFEFSHWQLCHAEAEMNRWTRVPFERCDSPMNRVVMISMPGGYKGIYLLVDHMTMDSSAIIVFMVDVIQLYCQRKYGMDAPKPLTSYIEQIKKDLEYEAGSPAKKRDEAFWKKFLEQPEPIFCDISGPKQLELERERTGNPNTRAARVTSDDVLARHEVFHLERHPADVLMNFCRDNRVPMVALILLALRTQISRMNGGEEDVSIMLPIARRGNKSEKKSGGTRVHFFPCRTIIGRETTFREALSIIQKNQMSLYRHANYDPVAFLAQRRERFHNEPGQSYECMSLTYQPLSMTTAPEELSHIGYQSHWYPNGVAANALYLTVMHQGLDEGMDFYFEYQTGRVTEGELEKLYYYVCRIMFQGVKDPEQTMGEIMDLV